MRAMHYIQKHILDELRTVESMRYARLNRDEIESGHFRYHLGQLVREGYVEPLERGLYGLTVRGQQYVDRLSENRAHARLMPKVITYTLLSDNDTILLQEKPKQPYMGLLNMIGGKLHQGETAAEAAVREVHEKTGNIITLPQLAGVFEILIYNGTDLLTHAVAYIFILPVRAVDYTLPAIKAIKVQDLRSTPNLAPDFLPVFAKIYQSSAVCVETLHVQYTSNSISDKTYSDDRFS